MQLLDGHSIHDLDLTELKMSGAWGLEYLPYSMSINTRPSQEGDVVLRANQADCAFGSLHEIRGMVCFVRLQ